MAKIIKLFFVIILAYFNLKTAASFSAEKIKDLQDKMNTSLVMLQSTYKMTIEALNFIKAEEILLKDLSIVGINFMHREKMMSLEKNLSHKDNIYNPSDEKYNNSLIASTNRINETNTKFLNDINACVNETYSLPSSLYESYEDILMKLKNILHGNIDKIIDENILIPTSSSCEGGTNTQDCLNQQRERHLEFWAAHWAMDASFISSQMNTHIIRTKSRSALCTETVINAIFVS